jgi:hypothetical protein
MVLVAMPILCQSQVTEEQKALDSFKSLVSHHADSYKPNGRVHITRLGGGWAKEQFTIVPGTMKFDVEKTASLVSPLIGTVTFTLNRSHGAFHSTEEEATTDTVFTHSDTTIHRHVFAYQEHQWQPTNRQYKHVGGSLDGDFPCDELLLKETKPSAKDIHGCLEEFDANK